MSHKSWPRQWLSQQPIPCLRWEDCHQSGSIVARNFSPGSYKNWPSHVFTTPELGDLRLKIKEGGVFMRLTKHSGHFVWHTFLAIARLSSYFQNNICPVWYSFQRLPSEIFWLRVWVEFQQRESLFCHYLTDPCSCCLRINASSWSTSQKNIRSRHCLDKKWFSWHNWGLHTC